MNGKLLPARSNYFRVKDELQFLKAVNKIDFVGVIKSNDGKKFAVVGTCPEGSGWPYHTINEKGEYEYVCPFTIVAEHLADGEIVAFIERTLGKYTPRLHDITVAYDNKLNRRDDDCRTLELNIPNGEDSALDIKVLIRDLEFKTRL